MTRLERYALGALADAWGRRADLRKEPPVGTSERLHGEEPVVLLSEPEARVYRVCAERLRDLIADDVADLDRSPFNVHMPP